MFVWYVPMKGNADVEAEDIYTYVNDKSSSFTPTVARAKGHTKYVSEDVMALIANTMQSAILQGERNKVKQKFLIPLAINVNRRNVLKHIADRGTGCR